MIIEQRKGVSNSAAMNARYLYSQSAGHVSHKCLQKAVNFEQGHMKTNFTLEVKKFPVTLL